MNIFKTLFLLMFLVVASPVLTGYFSPADVENFLYII